MIDIIAERLGGDAEITQLTHGSGLGLWVVRTVADADAATLTFAASPEGGSAVTLGYHRCVRPSA